jgi:hypothetical protein
MTGADLPVGLRIENKHTRLLHASAIFASADKPK